MRCDETHTHSLHINTSSLNRLLTNSLTHSHTHSNCHIHTHINIRARVHAHTHTHGFAGTAYAAQGTLTRVTLLIRTWRRSFCKRALCMRKRALYTRKRTLFTPQREEPYAYAFDAHLKEVALCGERGGGQTGSDSNLTSISMYACACIHLYVCVYHCVLMHDCVLYIMHTCVLS